MTQRVVIDYLSESTRHYRDGFAIVAVDVIRATTTAVSSVALGWRCFPVPSIEHAVPLAAKLHHPLLVGELGGNMPYGFDVTNSPVQVTARPDIARPIILLSSSGTRLICEAAAADAVYLACLRNYTATARCVAERHHRVAVIGAGSRGEFREEDQWCCALIASALVNHGYVCEDIRTRELIEQWASASPHAWKESKSVKYLRDSNQLGDLEFVCKHIDDLTTAFMLKHGEVTIVSSDVGDQIIEE